MSRWVTLIQERVSIILREFESLGGHASSIIKTTLPVINVWKCNILEDDEEPLEIRDGNISIALRAFEVAPFRLQLCWPECGAIES